MVFRNPAKWSNLKIVLKFLNHPDCGWFFIAVNACLMVPLRFKTQAL